MLVKKFSGINNQAAPRDAKPGDFQTMDNVLITDGGSVKVRQGKVQFESDAGHSLFSPTGSDLYYVAVGDLLYHDMGQNGPSTLVDTLSDDTTEMSYAFLNGNVYFSNGTDSGVIINGSVYPWSIAKPTSPTLADANGSGAPGTYIVVLTVELTDGQESAASAPVTVDVANGGISISNIPITTHPLASKINVYISGTNGEAGPRGTGLYRAVSITHDPNEQSGYSVVLRDLDTVGRECVTLNLDPMPAGKHIFFYHGRMYVVVDNFIFYSLPWRFGLTSLEQNFLPFEENVVTGIPLDNGIWVGTAKRAMFLLGNDPEDEGGFKIKSRIDEACVTGGVTIDREYVGVPQLASGRVGLLILATGIYAVDSNGMMSNMTGDSWCPPSLTSTLPGVVDTTANEARYMFKCGSSHYSMNLKTKAVTMFSNGCNSLAIINGITYAGTATNVVAFTGTDDIGTPIVARLTKNDMDFGSNKIKRLVAIYSHLSSTSAIGFTITSDSGANVIVSTDNIQTMHGHKAKFARGVKGRNFDIDIVNSSGSFFELADMEYIIEEDKTRWARQTA